MLIGIARNTQMGFFSSFEVFAALVGAIATALGGAAGAGLLEALKGRFEKWASATESSTREAQDPILSESSVYSGSPAKAGSLWNVAPVRFQLAKRQVSVRLRDARQAQLKQQSLARWARWSANSLTFGQYVIGGVMATSFIQKALSPDVVGVFGVLVVAASLFKQHYHPEVNAQNAAQQARQFEALIRQSEDRLVVIEAAVDPATDDPTLVLELLERVSAEITRITFNPPGATSAAPIQKRGK